jgi:hypothetical protein
MRLGGRKSKKQKKKTYSTKDKEEDGAILTEADSSIRANCKGLPTLLEGEEPDQDEDLPSEMVLQTLRHKQTKAMARLSLSTGRHQTSNETGMGTSSHRRIWARPRDRSDYEFSYDLDGSPTSSCRIFYPHFTKSPLYRHGRSYLERHHHLLLQNKRVFFPQGRAGHAVATDQLSKTMLIFGGYSGRTFLNDVWLLPVTRPRLPSLLALCMPIVAAHYDLDNISVPSELLQKLRCVDPPEGTALVWQHLAAAERGPGAGKSMALAAPRTASAAAFLGKKLWIFGGVGDFRQISSFNIVKKRWRSFELDNGPSVRHSLTLNPLCDRLYLFGGKAGLDFSQNQPFSDLWEFHTVKLEWKKLIESHQLVGRLAHTTGIIDEKLVICGGETQAGPIDLNKIDVVHITKDPAKWYSIPPHRIGGQIPIANTSNNTLCFGGTNLYCLSLSTCVLHVLPLHELTQYDEDRENGPRKRQVYQQPHPIDEISKVKFAWRKVPTVGDRLPATYTNASLAAVGRRLIVFGGCQKNMWVNHTYYIDVNEDFSQATVTDLQLLARSAGAAVDAPA